MSDRTRVGLAHLVATLAVIIFATLAVDRVHGWWLLPTFLGYFAAFIALAYLRDLARGKVRADAERANLATLLAERDHA